MKIINFQIYKCRDIQTPVHLSSIQPCTAAEECPPPTSNKQHFQDVETNIPLIAHVQMYKPSDKQHYQDVKPIYH